MVVCVCNHITLFWCKLCSVWCPSVLFALQDRCDRPTRSILVRVSLFINGYCPCSSLSYIHNRMTDNHHPAIGVEIWDMELDYSWSLFFVLWKFVITAKKVHSCSDLPAFVMSRMQSWLRYPKWFGCVAHMLCFNAMWSFSSLDRSYRLELKSGTWRLQFED